MQYDRVRKEIPSYDELASQKLSQAVPEVIAELVGKNLTTRMGLSGPVEGFPRPASVWIDSRDTPVAQLEAYEWLAPIEGSSFLQLGGSGSHAIKALAAGSSVSWLLTPVPQEALLAQRMAAHLGVVQDLHVVRGLGEKLPFADCTVDRIYGGSTLHHMDLQLALKEVARVLRPGGRAGFVDPNLNVIYRLLELTGLRKLGRDPRAQCYPIRLEDVYRNTQDFRTVRCLLSGGPARYAIVALVRVMRLRIPVSFSLWVQSFETKVLLRLRLHRMLGGLAVLVEK